MVRFVRTVASRALAPSADWDPARAVATCRLPAPRPQGIAPDRWRLLATLLRCPDLTVAVMRPSASVCLGDLVHAPTHGVREPGTRRWTVKERDARRPLFDVKFETAGVSGLDGSDSPVRAPFAMRLGASRFNRASCGATHLRRQER